MRHEKTTAPEAVLLAEDGVIPIAIIAVEIGQSVEWVVRQFGGQVVEDDIGMRCVSAQAAEFFFAARAEEKARRVEEAQARAAAAEKRPVLTGVPAKEGMTPYESMVAGVGLVTPAEEFGGREKPNFLEEQLAASAREIAEKRRQTAERNKQRAADKMKKDLS